MFRNRIARTWLGLALLGGLALACAAPPQDLSDEAAGPPLLPTRSGVNVLAVSFDALRADALGTYGYSRPTSPNIDRFAERSIVFERAYTAAPITPTAFASIFTGKLPHRAFRKWKMVSGPTLGSLFSDAGYATAAFMNNVNLTDQRNFGQGFDDFHWYRRTKDRKMLEEATTWLEQHAGGPFFAWLHFNSPHAPYDRRELAAHLYDPSYEGRFTETTGGQFTADDPEDIARIRSLYDGEVLFADSLFARLLELVERLGLTDDTLVLLTADHGEEFRERGGFQHKFLYEEIIHIPLIVHFPGHLQGTRRSELVSHLDLLPTLARVADLELPDDLDGLSFRDTPEADRAVVSEAVTNRDYIAVAGLLGREKLVVQCRAERSIRWYDLDEDPGEELAVDPTTRLDRVRRLRKAMYSALGGPPCTELRGSHRGDPTRDLDAESIDELRSLGYID